MKRQALLRSAAIVIGAASSSLLALLASPLPGMAFTLTSDSKGNPSIKGSWIGSMTHDGGGTNVVDITLTAPAQTFAGSTGALATLIDGLGHGTTTTFKINYSVKPTSADEYIYIPAKPNGKWYDWIITGEPTMAPDCANNDPDCGNVSSLMSVIFSGWVAPPLPQPGESGNYSFKTLTDRRPITVKEPRVPGRVPGPLPLLGVGAAFGYSRKLRKRIKTSKMPEVLSPIG